MLELDAGKELETGASLELDAGVLPGTASELDAATELDAGVSAEEDCSSDELETCELSLDRISVTCVEDESSPQATRPIVDAHKKTSERNLIQNNIKKIPDEVGDDILRSISRDTRLTSRCASRKTWRLGHAGKRACRRDSRLPIFGRPCLTADGFPGLAFAVLLVEILEQLRRFFRAHLAHLRGLFLRLLATAIGRISLAIA